MAFSPEKLSKIIIVNNNIDRDHNFCVDKIATVGDYTTSLIADEYSNNSKARNGVLCSDGNVYASPAGAFQMLQINMMHQTTSLIGPYLGTESA